MKIYRNGIEIQDIIHSDRATERKYLMDSHSVNIEFELSEHFQFLKGDNITIGGVSFSLPADYVAKHNQTTDGYRYQLEFFSREERWKDFVLKFEDLTEFPFTATGTQHLKLISDNLRDLGLGAFAYTSIDEVRHIEYKDISIFGALGLIAETFELEWWISDNTINLGILSAGVPFPLEYGQELKSIDVSKSSEKLITRLYAYGGTKNMTSGKRLSMTVPYIDAIPDLPQSRIVEGVKYFDDIFPKQKNTITDIETYVIQAEDREHQDTTIFKIKDTKVAQLTQDDLLPEALMINFTSGLLMGREFELSIQDDGYYEIIYTQDGDIYYPNPTLKPQIGDEYFLSGFKAEAVLPGLTAIAQAELLAEATASLQSIGSEYVYDVVTNPVYCEQNDVDLNLGRSVSISSPTLGEFASRIRGYEKNLLNKYDCKYQIGDSGLYSRISELETKVDQPVKVVIDDKNVKELREAFKRFFLSKTNPDTAQGFIEFLKGISVEELATLTQGLEIGNFQSGMHAGQGGLIDSAGNAELESMVLRSFLDVPTIRYNELEYIGEEIIIGAGAVLKDVEHLGDDRYQLTLKLEDGQPNPFRPSDLLKGIYNMDEGGNFTGFGTTYVSVSSIDEHEMIVILADKSDVVENRNMPPRKFMHLARIGNFIDTDRQSYISLSAKDRAITQYGGVNAFAKKNKQGKNVRAGVVTTQWGRAEGLEFIDNFENLPITKDSDVLYTDTLLYNKQIKVDYEGIAIKEYIDRGQWFEGMECQVTETTIDEAWFEAEKFRLIDRPIVDDAYITTEKPTRESEDWMLILSFKEEIDGSRGSVTFFAKPAKYKKGDRWILTEDIQLLNNYYLKGQILEAAYATNSDGDWRLMLIEGDEEETEGINLIRNYTFKEGAKHWGNIEESIVGMDDEIPTDYYTPSINVLGDEYGYEYAITTENDELIILDE